jgi:hypothetical protein
MTIFDQQLGCAEMFLRYLQDQHEQLVAAYSEFRSDRCGASFVIRQIQHAIDYFRNPVLSGANREPNVLDE